MQVRKNAEQAAANERKALLGSPDPLERQRRLESEADLTDAAQDITASLQRTRQQMTQARNPTFHSITTNPSLFVTSCCNNLFSEAEDNVQLCPYN